MDLTTLIVAVMMLFGTITVDTILHPRDIVIEAHTSSNIGTIYVTDQMLTDVMQREISNIALTPSVVAKPTVRLSTAKGIGVAMADSFGLSGVANAIQEQAGYRTDRIVVYVYSEGGKIKAAVTGVEIHAQGRFLIETDLRKDEAITDLVQRATEIGMEQVEPYLTALYLMRKGVPKLDFAPSLRVIADARGRMPRGGNGTTFQSMLLNLEGMIALLQDNRDLAVAKFRAAMATDPKNQVAVLNLAITQVVSGATHAALSMLDNMLATNEPKDKVVLSLTHTAIGAARLKDSNWKGAEASFQQAVNANAANPVTYALWAEARRQQGDLAGAKAMIEKAQAASGDFEDYAEVAGLYFAVRWQGGAPYLFDPFNARSFETGAGPAPAPAPGQTPSGPPPAAK